MEIYPVSNWNKSRDEGIDLYQIVKFNLCSKFKNTPSLRFILSSKIISYIPNQGTVLLATFYDCYVTYKKRHGMSHDQLKQISTSNEYDTLLGELKAQNDEVNKVML